MRCFPVRCIVITTVFIQIISICNGQTIINHPTNRLGSTTQTTPPFNVTKTGKYDNPNNFNLTCNNWLYLPSGGSMSYAEVGDLDIPGNQVSVEAVFNRIAPYSSDAESGNIVSKHRDPPTVNYLLRPNSAYITTNNGFYAATAPCEAELNKTYHVALTYDGTT